MFHKTLCFCGTLFPQTGRHIKRLFFWDPVSSFPSFPFNSVQAQCWEPQRRNWINFHLQRVVRKKCKCCETLQGLDGFVGEENGTFPLSKHSSTPGSMTWWTEHQQDVCLYLLPGQIPLEQHRNSTTIHSNPGHGLCTFCKCMKHIKTLTL